MNKLKILLDRLQWDDPYFGEWTQEHAVTHGWNAARDKIIEILESNIQPGYHEEPGGRIGFDVREIPWPYADRVIEQIKNL